MPSGRPRPNWRAPSRTASRHHSVISFRGRSLGAPSQTASRSWSTTRSWAFCCTQSPDYTPASGRWGPRPGNQAA
eukprot:9481147-Pyramimonas_sp.AAC.1